MFRTAPLARSAVLAAAVVFALLWFGAGIAAAGETMMGAKTGDVTGEGNIDSIDAALVLQYGAGLGDQEPSEVWFAAADVNCDLAVNPIDATLILQAGAGLYNLRP